MEGVRAKEEILSMEPAADWLSCWVSEFSGVIKIVCVNCIECFSEIYLMWFDAVTEV